MTTEVEALPCRHRITVDDYYRMAEVGLLEPDARVELIEGEIIDMPPIGSLHGGVVSRLYGALQVVSRDKAMVRAQLPVRLNIRSEPEPDLAVVKARDDHYMDAHPTGEDTFLLVEVSYSTLAFDRKIKVPLYARHGIPEVWIVDLRHNQLHSFRTPSKGEYAEAMTTSIPRVASIAALAGIEVDLSWLAGRGPRPTATAAGRRSRPPGVRR